MIPRAPQLARASLAVGTGFIIAAFAVWYLGEALYLSLAPPERLGPAGAALAVGMTGLALATLMMLLARRLLAAPSNGRAALSANVAPGADGASDVAAQLGELVARQIVTSTRTHPYGTAGAALVAGLAIGALPELRKLLGDILR